MKSKSNILFKNDGSLHVGSIYADKSPGESTSGLTASPPPAFTHSAAPAVEARRLDGGLFFTPTDGFPAPAPAAAFVLD